MPDFPTRPLRHSQRRLGNLIGDNLANDVIDTSAVTANADGSLLERAEYLQGLANGTVAPTGLPASYDGRLGYHVTKVGDLATVGAIDDLFAVVNKCLITLMVGEVTSVVATTTSLQLIASVGSRIFCVSTDIVTELVNTLYMLTGDIDDVLTGVTQNLVGSAIMKAGNRTDFLMNDNVLQQKVDAAGTGLIQWDLWYIPLEAGASITSSA